MCAVVDPAEKAADLGRQAAAVNQTGHFTFRAAQYVVNFIRSPTIVLFLLSFSTSS